MRGDLYRKAIKESKESALSLATGWPIVPLGEMLMSLMDKQTYNLSLLHVYLYGSRTLHILDMIDDIAHFVKEVNT